MRQLFVKDVMTRDLEVVHPLETLEIAAQKMKKQEIGALPVCNENEITGVITDRDIVIRAVAEHKNLNETPIQDVMTQEVFFCSHNDSLDDAAKFMQKKQVRRLVVLDENKDLVGILSIGDLAVGADDHSLIATTLRKVSEPYISRFPFREVRGRRAITIAGGSLGALALAGGTYWLMNRNRAA